VGVLLLDFVTYALHRLMHAIPLLWRLHQVHHSDGDMNASTHFRQHPLQLVVAMLMQLPALWLLGISGVSWVLYGALSAAIQLWQHAALDHAALLDRWLRPILVTPAMHRVHHDHRQQFHDTNYGALFSFWDRLLGTYTPASPDIRLGLSRPDGKRATHQTSFMDCLWMPFRSSPTPAAKAATPRFQTHLRGKK
jgi:sterol desaturase/sphingolipid hydroxylase (fatty acid hydroxylase superfamily)